MSVICSDELIIIETLDENNTETVGRQHSSESAVVINKNKDAVEEAIRSGSKRKYSVGVGFTLVELPKVEFKQNNVSKVTIKSLDRSSDKYYVQFKCDVVIDGEEKSILLDANSMVSIFPNLEIKNGVIEGDFKLGNYLSMKPTLLDESLIQMTNKPKEKVSMTKLRKLGHGYRTNSQSVGLIYFGEIYQWFEYKWENIEGVTGAKRVIRLLDKPHKHELMAYDYNIKTYPDKLIDYLYNFSTTSIGELNCHNIIDALTKPALARIDCGEYIRCESNYPDEFKNYIEFVHNNILNGNFTDSYSRENIAMAYGLSWDGENPPVLDEDTISKIQDAITKQCAIKIGDNIYIGRYED